MLSLHLIERFLRGKHFDALLDGVSANGLQLPLPLKVRLGQHPAAAVALGLRRLLELTYGPTALSRQMTAFLLDAQASDGSFDGDPLATATAAAVLGRLLADPRHTAAQGPDADRLAPALHRALAALAAMQSQDPDALFFRAGDDRTDEQRALVAAFILYLLAGQDAFRQTMRFAELMSWFEQQAPRLDADTHRLWRMARADTPESALPACAAAA